MQCDVCLRVHSARLPFNCTTCARQALYEPRIQLAHTLLQSEAVGKEVESQLAATQATITTTTKKKVAPKPAEGCSAWMLEQAVGEQVASTERTLDILSHVDALRKETDRMRTEVAKRKANLLRRRSDLKSAHDALSQREAVAIDPVEKGVQRMEHRWDAMHTKTAESRVFLCREAAQLYGLQQRKRKSRGPGRDVYLIGGIPIADLRDLNSMSRTFSCSDPKLILPRCFSSPGHDLHQQSRTSHTSNLALPICPSSRRNHPQPSRLPFTYHFPPDFFLHLSRRTVSRIHSIPLLEQQPLGLTDSRPTFSASSAPFTSRSETFCSRQRRSCCVRFVRGGHHLLGLGYRVGL